MDIKKYQHDLACFAAERDWDQFHTPKNLSMALAKESSELLEIFQWLSDKQSAAIREQKKEMLRVSEEMADVFIYLMRLADKLDVDIETAVAQKMEMNRAKYPVELAKGNAVKYNRRKPRA
ncbi:MAG TPA: nucleotide pyrophosphohydrolase [Dissulfurispiraceae bacterium]|nr:nucleotide pyrophosphohydrolase [Dissulfurispiraceae bacterium]